ncbi:metabolite traffic protein EboE [Verrucomicrobiota bacterium]
MKTEKHPTHLTYCLNVHPGESWAENFEAIKTNALAVRERISPDRPFGLGLRFCNAAAETLSEEDNINEFKRFLEENNLYVFTVNAFPYGAFHGKRVKENVYLPDWRSNERVAYTKLVVDILSQLLPEGVSGSVSTVPGAYKKSVGLDSDKTLIVKNLMDCASYLDHLYKTRGKDICLGLEPEPDCLFENTQETIDFFAGLSADRGGRHLGVCFDTCHMAVQFENISDSLEKLVEAGIRISKVQLSSAVKAMGLKENIDQLKKFDDKTYLHQVRVRKTDGEQESWPDLPEALEEGVSGEYSDAEWRIHCHVPLYFESHEGIYSTADELTPEFFKNLAAKNIDHIEIETYTFNVLPEEIRNRDIVQSIVEEYKWVRERL